MKGEAITQFWILTLGAIIVSIVITLMFAMRFFSGVDAYQSNEDATLGYQLMNMMNILDFNEFGSITQELVKVYKIIIEQSDGKSRLKVGDREFDLLVNVKPTNFITKRGVTVSKTEEGLEIVNLL